MLAGDFVRKWSGGPAAELGERAGAQSHFIDLCRVLGVEEPGDPERYCFERGVTKTGSFSARTDGFADVWLKARFAWEYKAPGKSLEGALKQLMLYALPLESPPLLVVSDRLRIEVHTHFTGTPTERHVFQLDDILDPRVQQRLRTLWTNPEVWRPNQTNRQITEDAASTFAEMAERMRSAGVAAEEVSHFLTQCVFCFFAEDVDLLPARLFERLVKARVQPDALRLQLDKLFGSMRDGGLFGVDDVPWFNGGLFARIAVPPLSDADVTALRAASELNWSAIDPSIFGTLFERGLDPTKRSQLGAHYTDPATIHRLIEPVIVRPLLDEWTAASKKINNALATRDALRAEATTIPSTTKALRDRFARVRTRANDAERDAQATFQAFLERLKAFRVLDPACGSGNFLYLALKALKDIEHQVNFEAEALGLQRQIDGTGPHNVLGIEINEYAAELARVTVWIGELQWRIDKGLPAKTHPVLEPLDHIECRDALIDGAGRETSWPTADAVIGNPPFLGTKKQWRELGVEYSEAIRSVFDGRVPGFADLVCYWFEKARNQIEAGAAARAGLVATNSIRGGANRMVLDRIEASTRIFEAWSDLDWVNEGAAVRVSLLAFGESSQPALLDGVEVAAIHADLTSDVDLTLAAKLSSNKGASFVATVKSGAFDVPGETARKWLLMPNPHGVGNHEVVKRWANGMDMTRRWSDTWIVDFGMDRTADQAALFEAPFAHIKAHVQPKRAEVRRQAYREQWWLFAEPIPKMRRALAGLGRYIATPVVAKHRLFVWLDRTVMPDHQLVVTAREDDATFGILHSRFHEIWALRMCTWMGVGNDPRYTPTTCFETFPFPSGLAPSDTAHQRIEVVADGAVIPAGLAAPSRAHAVRIGTAARRLVELRNGWLNPPEWTDAIDDLIPLGEASSPYPKRLVPKAGFEQELARRTLTHLYNQRPTWLLDAHSALDSAVAEAYGWEERTCEASIEEILRRLLALNLERNEPPAVDSVSTPP